MAPRKSWRMRQSRRGRRRPIAAEQNQCNPELREEDAMRLTQNDADNAARQLEARPLPENHPVAESLVELFGEHTFFVDADGLFIVETAERELDGGAELGRVVKLANWVDEHRTVLSPHRREDTDIVVTLDDAA
jgi:hypothetical protein